MKKRKRVEKNKSEIGDRERKKKRLSENYERVRELDKKRKIKIEYE